MIIVYSYRRCWAGTTNYVYDIYKSADDYTGAKTDREVAVVDRKTNGLENIGSPYIANSYIYI